MSGIQYELYIISYLILRVCIPLDSLEMNWLVRIFVIPSVKPALGSQPHRELLDF